MFVYHCHYTSKGKTLLFSINLILAGEVAELLKFVLLTFIKWIIKKYKLIKIKYK